MSYPQKPETWKVTATGEGCSIRFGVSAMQGWRREMRDAHVCNLNNFSFAGWGFFGVFDGHFSPKVSQYCSQNLLDCIVESTELDSDCELSADAVKDGIYKGFLKIDHRLKNLPQWANGEDRGGTTATVVFVSPKEIIWGNCGNTRGLLCRNGKVVFATEEHLPFNEKEKSRIEKAGGTVRMQRINGTLGFSRALGDFYFKCAAELPATEQLVSPEPELTIQEREPSTDEFLFLACKGVFGYMTNEEVIAYIRHKLELTDDLSEICSDLIDLCLNKNSRDNMTAILVTFQNAPKVSQEAIEQNKKLQEEARDTIESQLKQLVEAATNPIELDESYVMELLATTLPENYDLVSKRLFISDHLQELRKNKFGNLTIGSLLPEVDSDETTSPSNGSESPEEMQHFNFTADPSEASERASANGNIDRIAKYCCFLQNLTTEAYGNGFIVEFQDLLNSKLLALDWERRNRKGRLQTNYALVTSHDTIPGLSHSDLNGWTVSCQGIETLGHDHMNALTSLVCGVLSCCGPESLFAGQCEEFHAHYDANCNIQLNISILFLNKFFEELLQGVLRSGYTVYPPVISVQKCLDQDAYSQEYEQVISSEKELAKFSLMPFNVYYCDGVRSSPQTATVSVVEQKHTTEHEEAIRHEIMKLERLQKLYYTELNSSTFDGNYNGSPVVYHNPVTNECFIIGVQVGEIDQKGQYVAVTLHGILRLLQGGLISVLSVLQHMEAPNAWVSRWGYLVTPHIDQMEVVESDYLCEVLHYLLKERLGTSLVTLTVDLLDVDQEAALNLLCALFKHFASADNSDLNEAVTRLCLKEDISSYITRLCKDLLHLLEFDAVKEPMGTGRTTVIEKCCIFYSRLLDIKYEGITEQILCTSQNLELLKCICQRYKHSDVVQENVIDISLTCFRLKNGDKSSHSSAEHYLGGKELLALRDVLQEDVIDSLKHKGLDLNAIENVQTTLEEVRQLLHSIEQHEIASSLQRLIDFALENQSHYKAYQQALKEGVAISLKYLKVLFFGPPRTGKTSMRRRLVGEIQNLAKEPVQASTGTAEVYDVIVKVVEDKITTSTTVITKSKWSTVKALFGKEKSTHETDLDEELQLLYQFIYKAAPIIENRSPVLPVIEEEYQRPSLSESVEEEAIDEGTDTAKDTVPNPIPRKAVKISRNTSLLRQISYVCEPGHEMSAKEIEDIETAFVAFRKILHAPGQEQLKVLLEGTILMNMVDTGGQPAFLEMLPALTISPALYLIFFRLDQELKKRYQILYVSENNEHVQVGESSYTVEEVLFQALSSIACFSCTAPKKAGMPNPAVLIGTHKDLLGSDPEKVATELKAKDDALQKDLREILEADLESDMNFLHYASNDQLMFAIDNMTGDDKEVTKVRKRLENIINQEFDNFTIPASWLMFSIFLRKMGNRTMSLLQCREIGERLEVRDTDEALWFLHDCIGTLMHFPDVEEIRDIVICDPQVVFDSVTDLILNSFNLKRVSKFACEKFEQTGQFRFKDIQKIARNSKSDGLCLPKLVKLLGYLNIIAPINPEYPSFPVFSPSSGLPLTPELRADAHEAEKLHSTLPLSPEPSPQSGANQREKLLYFMPAVLKHATEEELLMKQNPTDPVPLMISFKCGFVPVGVFCAMIANLVAQKDTLGWLLQEPHGGHVLCKNKVTFRISGTFDVTLISKPKRYEVHVSRISYIGRSLFEICQHILETVCDTLDQVISKMKYKQYLISSRSDQTLYELGFKCPKHPGDDHLVINRPEGGVKAPSQSAKFLWLNYLKGKSVMICPLEGGRAIDLRDSRFSTQQGFVWFGKATETSPVLPSIPEFLPPPAMLQPNGQLTYPLLVPQYSPPQQLNSRFQGDHLILSEKDLHILTEILRPAAPQWRTIGGSLGILDTDLNIIQYSPLLIPEGLPGYFREMLCQWLKMAPPYHPWPNLNTLAVALQSSGHEGLAVNLKPLFLQRKGRVFFTIWNWKSSLEHKYMKAVFGIFWLKQTLIYLLMPEWCMVHNYAGT